MNLKKLVACDNIILARDRDIRMTLARIVELLHDALSADSETGPVR